MEYPTVTLAIQPVLSCSGESSINEEPGEHGVRLNFAVIWTGKVKNCRGIINEKIENGGLAFGFHFAGFFASRDDS
jgi:hypothetical protein